MRKIPSEDRTLYDHIKEMWKNWVTDNGDPFMCITDFNTDFLIGYFACYYKGDTKHFEQALEYFQSEIDIWEEEDTIDENDDE